MGEEEEWKDEEKEDKRGKKTGKKTDPCAPKTGRSKRNEMQGDATGSSPESVVSEQLVAEINTRRRHAGHAFSTARAN